MKNEKLENGFTPLGMLVLIRREKPKTEVGGIRLPDRAIARSRFGTVIRCGPGQTIDGVLRTVPLQPGELVMFDEVANRFAYADQQLNRMVPISEEFEDYALVPEIGVFGVMGGSE